MDIISIGDFKLAELLFTPKNYNEELDAPVKFIIFV